MNRTNKMSRNTKYPPGYVKFDPKTHIAGKVYDLSQENMNLMIKEIERLQNLPLKSYEAFRF